MDIYYENNRNFSGNLAQFFNIIIQEFLIHLQCKNQKDFMSAMSLNLKKYMRNFVAEILWFFHFIENTLQKSDAKTSQDEV